MKISFQMLSYWRVGTGEESGSALDAVCARDKDGLPYIPGRQVRGLFREAATDAIGLNWIDAHETDLFGSRQSATADTASDDAHDTNAGTLRFENASFPTAEKAALIGNTELSRRLFEIKRATAINRETGTAKNRSLRAEEVAIPMTLIAEVTGMHGAPDGWERHLSESAPLIRAIGNGRNRGLGRVIVTCNEKSV